MAKSKKSKPASKGKRAKKSAEPEQAQLPMPSDRDLKHYISALAVADARVKKEQDARKKIYDAANAVGINKTALDRGRSLAKRNPLDVKNELMQTQMVLAELGAPVQFEVFDNRNGDPVAQAKVQGFADGKAAKDKDASQYGFIKGSPASRAYDEAYDEGQAENASGIRKAAVGHTGKEISQTAH